MSLDPKLLDILVCPQDKGPLNYLAEEQVLVMLVDHAKPWPPEK